MATIWDTLMACFRDRPIWIRWTAVEDIIREREVRGVRSTRAVKTKVEGVRYARGATSLSVKHTRGWSGNSQGVCVWGHVSWCTTYEAGVVEYCDLVTGEYRQESGGGLHDHVDPFDTHVHPTAGVDVGQLRTASTTDIRHRVQTQTTDIRCMHT